MTGLLLFIAGALTGWTGVWFAWRLNRVPLTDIVVNRVLRPNGWEVVKLAPAPTPDTPNTSVVAEEWPRD